MQFNIFTTISALVVASQVSAAAPQSYSRPAPPSAAGCKQLANGIVYDCGSANDSFHITNVILLPPKPVKGQPLDIHLVGELREVVTFGSKTVIKASYGGVQVLNLNKDICELAVQRKTGYSCPVKPQYFNTHHTLQIPSYAPGGDYEIDAFGVAQNNRQIFKVKIFASL